MIKNVYWWIGFLYAFKSLSKRSVYIRCVHTQNFTREFENKSNRLDICNLKLNSYHALKQYELQFSRWKVFLRKIFFLLKWQKKSWFLNCLLFFVGESLKWSKIDYCCPIQKLNSYIFIIREIFLLLKINDFFKSYIYHKRSKWPMLYQ